MADKPSVPSLISDEYREAQTTLHEDPNYGVASLVWAERVWDTIQHTGAEEILDYGCGKGRLGDALRDFVTRPIGVAQYDPAIPEVSDPPEPAELVVCLDVLEHIEPDCLNAVLDDLQRVTVNTGFFTISTVPARKVLADGRNAHLIQEGLDFWLPKLWERFRIMSILNLPDTLIVMVAGKQGGH